MYLNGEGVPQDYVQALMWFNLAASEFDGSCEEAHKIREGIAAKMTPAQIAEAQKLAREWKPAPPK
jgi:TPR repeat protein